MYANIDISELVSNVFSDLTDEQQVKLIEEIFEDIPDRSKLEALEEMYYYLGINDKERFIDDHYEDMSTGVRDTILKETPDDDLIIELEKRGYKISEGGEQ